MPLANVNFRELIQDTQTYESFDTNQDHMVSQILFNLEVAGQNYPDMMVEVRQPFGTRYEEEPLEVAKPTGSYSGPWNHAAFRDYCEQYYRILIGKSGGAIRMEGCSNVRMRNNHFKSSLNVSFEIPEGGGGAW